MTRKLVLLLPIAFAALLQLGWSPPNHATPDSKPTPPLPLITDGSRTLPEAALTFDACPAVGYDAAIQEGRGR